MTSSNQNLGSRSKQPPLKRIQNWSLLSPTRVKKWFYLLWLFLLYNFSFSIKSTSFLSSNLAWAEPSQRVAVPRGTTTSLERANPKNSCSLCFPKACGLIPVVSRSTALSRFLKSVPQRGALNLPVAWRVSELFLKVSVESSLESLISALLLGSCSSEKPITCSQSILALDPVLLVLHESSANNSNDQVVKNRSLLSCLRHLEQQLPLHVLHSSLHLDISLIYHFLQHTSLSMKF